MNTLHDGVLHSADLVFEVVRRVVSTAGLPVDAESSLPHVTRAPVDDAVPLACRHLGLEAHRTYARLDALSADLCALAPVLLYVPTSHEVIGVVQARTREVRVIHRDGPVDWLPIGELQRLLGYTPSNAQAEPEGTGPIERLLALLPPNQHEQGAVLAFGLAPSAGAPLLQQLVGAGVAGRLAGLAVLHALRMLLFASSWWVLGRSAFEGGLDGPMLVGWFLVLASLAAVTALVDWTQGHLLLDVNLRYRRKVLHGATKVEPSVPLSMGSGQLLSRVFETEALDTLAVDAGLSAFTAAVDVAFTLALLAALPHGWPLALAFLAWLLVVLLAGVVVYRQQHGWTLDRIAMSERVVQGLLGRRTLVAQLPEARRLADEAHALQRYLERSTTLDRTEVRFNAAAGRGWLLVGLVGLGLLAGLHPLTPATVAMALGGVLLGSQALGRVAGSVDLVSAVVISWQQARVLYEASSVPEPSGVPEIVLAHAHADRSSATADPVLQTHRVRVQPRYDRAAVLHDVSVGLHAGERVLLTGASGSGKSTLARVLCGLQPPTQGTMSLRGFDPQSLGPTLWARQVAFVPSFSDNHVFSSSFLRNLLLAAWPPSLEERAVAQQVCEELGLGPLLERMPGGLDQMVGETGWRLSHGEQSRLFVARALLQRPSVVILDESFGALDANALQQCMECVWRRVSSVIVISHA